MEYLKSLAFSNSDIEFTPQMIFQIKEEGKELLNCFNTMLRDNFPNILTDFFSFYVSLKIAREKKRFFLCLEKLRVTTMKQFCFVFIYVFSSLLERLEILSQLDLPLSFMNVCVLCTYIHNFIGVCVCSLIEFDITCYHSIPYRKVLRAGVDKNSHT